MKLKRTLRHDIAKDEPGGWKHWCVACNEMHTYAVEHPFYNGARWTFDGNMEQPTFSPSMNIKIGPMPIVPKGRNDAGKVCVCHYTITAGKVTFHGDCTHEYRGKTVALADIPERFR